MFVQISVIVPALNEEARIDGLLKALASQDHPSYEVIVVDNGSEDATVARARCYDNVRVEIEPRRNAECARNRGAALAKGEVLAFTDADCIPSPSWLTEAVQALERFDLVAGQIQFALSQPPAAAEIFDSVSNLQHEESVRDRQVAFTANLLVPSRIFAELGGFPEDTLGGGDLLFTSHASKAGYRIGYCPRAIVTHPARQLRELAAKAFRIGREKGAALGREQQVPALEPSTATRIPHVHHLRPSRLRQRLVRSEMQLDPITFAKVWAHGPIYIAAGVLGVCSGLLRSWRGPTR